MRRNSGKIMLVAFLALFGLRCGGDGATQGNFVVKGSPSSTATLSRLSPYAGDSATTAGSPTSLKLRIYAVYISGDTDCSSPQKVADFGSSGKLFELFDNPTIVDTTLADGTYKCLILKASDIIQFKADQTAVDAFAPACDTTTQYSFDAYRTGEPETDKWIDLDGKTITAHGTVNGPVADEVFLFASTDAAAATAGGKAVDSTQKAVLKTALVVPAQTTLYIDASDRVSAPPIAPEPRCWLEGFEAGFR